MTNHAGHNRFPSDVIIRHEFKPGDIGYLTYLHGVLYAKECGWDHTFESYVAIPLSRFAQSHSERERIWLLESSGVIAGSIAIVNSSDANAQLRWFLLHPDLRGRGLGRALMEDAMAFCRAQTYQTVFLWTEARLTVAAALYRSVGFQLTEEISHEQWGTTVVEQRYDKTL